MSVSLTVNCNRTGRYGTCAIRFYAQAASATEARRHARLSGWSNAAGGLDYCPGHSGKTTPPTPITRLHPEEP